MSSRFENLGAGSHLTILEPWGLGDLAIAMLAAKALDAQGWKVDVICSPTFAPWVAALPFVADTIPFSIPWTSQTRKYAPWRYDVRQFVTLRRTLHTKGYDAVAEIRGDIRNVIFLKALGVAPVAHLYGQNISYRFDRPKALLTTLGFHDTSITDIKTRPRPDDVKNVFTFFGASRLNRQLPAAQAIRIVKGLLDLGLEVSACLAPTDDDTPWQAFKRQVGGRLSVIQPGLAETTRHIESADLCLSTDTGWQHVAYLLGVPTISLFGFDNFKEWAPPGCRVVAPPTCHPASELYSRLGQDLSPLTLLDAETVVEAVRAHLDRQRHSLYGRAV